MKSIFGIIIVAILSLFTFYGLSNVGEQVAITQPISTDSLNQIAVINSNINNYKNNVTANINPNINPNPTANLTGLSAYIQEYKDYKTKMDSFKETLYTVYKIPDIIILIVPFVDYETLGFYADILRGLIWIIIILVIYVALRGGDVFSRG